MRAYERLLNYVKVYTTSEDEQENVPSTSRQFDLGNQLAEELKKIGVQLTCSPKYEEEERKYHGR